MLILEIRMGQEVGLRTSKSIKLVNPILMELGHLD